MQHDDLNQISEAAEDTQSHNVQLHNLRSGTIYFYQVVSSANGVRAMTFVDEFVTSGDLRSTTLNRPANHPAKGASPM